MSLQQFLNSFMWTRYSKILMSKIDEPHCAGVFIRKEAAERGMRLVEGSKGSIEEGYILFLFWLVDPEDGLIVDAKFQVFGQTALIGAAEVACELLVGKNYLQAQRLTTELIEKQVLDKNGRTFPREAFPYLNLVLEVIESCADQCKDLPIPESNLSTPVPTSLAHVEQGEYPGWKELSLKEKLSLIEEVLDQDIRPYIALDAGGVIVLNLIDDKELIIAYQGSCTSCYSSVGTTLSYIQQIIRTKLHPDITVTPQMNDFH